jgi:hypothetical protein
MRKFIVAATAIAALAVPSLASAAAPINCTDGSWQGKTITTSVNVPAGATCDLSWADVTTGNNVTVNGHLRSYGQTHFGKNVTINQGGSFDAGNWGIVIDGNLAFTNPATYSYNGFFSLNHPDWDYSVVHGNIDYKITSAMAYPDYQSPLLYFGGGVKVDGNFSYSDQGTGFPGHLDTGGLTARNFK